MTTKKRAVPEEPLLNTLARKLGRAAGTLTNVTQELTDNLSSLPDAVTSKVRETIANANSGPAKSRKKLRPSSPAKKAKGKAVAKKKNPKGPKKPRSQGKRKPAARIRRSR